jgi:hypothetical protein
LITSKDGERGERGTPRHGFATNDADKTRSIEDEK